MTYDLLWADQASSCSLKILIEFDLLCIYLYFYFTNKLASQTVISGNFVGLNVLFFSMMKTFNKIRLHEDSILNIEKMQTSTIHLN